jgi:hypothetical protein
MFRKVLHNKSFWALLLPILMLSATYAGTDCDKKSDVAAAGKGAHCHLLAKNITKSGEATENGAIVTLTGKSEEAVAHIKEHLGAHAKGSGCPECPLSMEGVTTTVKVTEDGGVITATGNSPETVKKLQEWAKMPAGQCCKKSKADKV